MDYKRICDLRLKFNVEIFVKIAPPFSFSDATYKTGNAIAIVTISSVFLLLITVRAKMQRVNLVLVTDKVYRVLYVTRPDKIAHYMLKLKSDSKQWGSA